MIHVWSLFPALLWVTFTRLGCRVTKKYVEFYTNQHEFLPIFLVKMWVCLPNCKATFGECYHLYVLFEVDLYVLFEVETNPWRGAEAFHLFLLVQRLLYKGYATILGGIARYSNICFFGLIFLGCFGGVAGTQTFVFFDIFCAERYGARHLFFCFSFLGGCVIQG
jgi:hypothetical protein